MRRRMVRFRRPAGMTADQRQHLECRHAFFCATDPFPNDTARRECWRAHRALLLREWDSVLFTGARPAALWDYDADAAAALDEHASEAAAVHATMAGSSERRRIELRWLAALE